MAEGGCGGDEEHRGGGAGPPPSANGRDFRYKYKC